MKNKKILIIEDEELILEAYSEGLKEKGFDLVGARDGETGLRLIPIEKPDIILLDLMLPKMPGEQVLKTMKEKGLLEDYPVIVLSNKADIANINNCLISLGAKDYLVKSNYSIDELVQKVNSVISKFLR